MPTPAEALRQLAAEHPLDQVVVWNGDRVSVSALPDLLNAEADRLEEAS